MWDRDGGIHLQIQGWTKEHQEALTPSLLELNLISTSKLGKACAHAQSRGGTGSPGLQSGSTSAIIPQWLVCAFVRCVEVQQVHEYLSTETMWV